MSRNTSRKQTKLDKSSEDLKRDESEEGVIVEPKATTPISQKPVSMRPEEIAQLEAEKKSLKT